MIDGAPGLRKQEFQKENFVFHDAIHLAIEVAEASNGSLPTEAQFDLLHQNGYIAYTSDEVVSIFYGWQDYHQVAATYYEDFLDEKDSKKREILGIIQSERQLGRLPDELFKVKEHYREMDEDGQPVKGNHAGRYRLTEDDAPERIQLSRYAKYEVLEHVLRECNGQEMTDENKLNIVLGFTQATGKAKTSFIGAIQSARPEISVADIENAAELLGFYEYVFPQHRQAYLKEILKVVHVQPEQVGPIRSYFDKKTGKLLLGDTEKRNYLQENPAAKKHVKHLGRLLLEKEVDVKFGRRGQANEWDKSKYMSYGKWLVKVLSLYDETLSVEVLKRGYELGIGPHPDRVRKKFDGSVVNYFQELTDATSTYVGDDRRGVFKDWVFEDYVDHIKKVSAENDGVITKKVLLERIKNGALEPSPHMIEKKFGLKELLEAAGLPNFSKTYSPEQCIEVGLRFARANNGKTPSEVDMQRTDYLMSEYLVRKHFGKVSAYREIVQSKLDSETNLNPTLSVDGQDSLGDGLLAA
jgi:hypothetical protein